MDIDKAQRFLENLKALEKGTPTSFEGLDTTFQDLGEFLWFISTRFFVGNNNSCGLHIATIKDTEGTKELFYSEECLLKPAVFHFVRGFKIIEIHLPSQTEVKNDTSKEILEPQKSEIVKFENNPLTPLEQMENELKAYHPLFPIGEAVLLAGASGVGKSCLIPCLIEELLEQINNFVVLYFALDEDLNITKSRFALYPKVQHFQGLHFFNRESLKELFPNSFYGFLICEIIKELVDKFPPDAWKLVIVDCSKEFEPYLDLCTSKKNVKSVCRILDDLFSFLRERRVTLLMLHHVSKVYYKIKRNFPEKNLVSEFMESVQGLTYFIASFHTKSILIEHPENERVRILAIRGRHLPDEKIFYYEKEEGSLLYRKTSAIPFSSNFDNLSKDEELKAFLQLLRELGSAKFSEIFEKLIEQEKITTEPRKAYQRLYKKVLRKDNKNSLIGLGLIAMKGDLIHLTDLGALAIKKLLE